MTKQFYFKHGTQMRNEREGIAVRMSLGWAGYGLYCAVMELLTERTVEKEQTIIFELGISQEQWAVLRSFFKEKDGYISTSIAAKSISERMEISEKRSRAGKIGAERRWKEDDGKNGKKWQNDHGKNDLPEICHTMETTPTAHSDGKNGKTIANEWQHSYSYSNSDLEPKGSKVKTDKNLGLTKAIATAYEEWCKLNGIIAYVDASEMASAKKIGVKILSLSKQNADIPEAERIEKCIEFWKTLLKHRAKWSAFDQNNTALKQLNSRFHNIVNSVKNGQTKSTGNSVSATIANIGVIDF